MSAEGGDVAAPREVVIVRRRGGGEDEGHHGGAWKIAFADLMTAMMTFFLVMWLLNISDKQKIVRIATYFNPTKLSDQMPTNKGVHEVNQADEMRGADPAADMKPKDEMKSPPTEKKHKTGGDGAEIKGDPKKAEEELFNDPYGVLARMALKAMTKGELANGGTREGEEMMPGGDAFRNPFEPYAETKPVDPAEAEPSEVEAPPVEAAAPAAPAAEPAPGEDPTVAKDEAPPAAPSQVEARALEREIMKSIATLAPERTPNIDVKKTDEGLLISLTDDFRFGMFAVASAEPKPEVVVVMEKIAKLLAAREGKVVVAGHTDGRPFQAGGKNENWRLSMARAQIAYYMLVRGGLAENRVERIEGYADRKLKVQGDPNASQNRRIEILLRSPT